MHDKGNVTYTQTESKVEKGFFFDFGQHFIFHPGPLSLIMNPLPPLSPD